MVEARLHGVGGRGPGGPEAETLLGPAPAGTSPQTADGSAVRLPPGWLPQPRGFHTPEHKRLWAGVCGLRAKPSPRLPLPPRVASTAAMHADSPEPSPVCVPEHREALAKKRATILQLMAYQKSCQARFSYLSRSSNVGLVRLPVILWAHGVHRASYRLAAQEQRLFKSFCDLKRHMSVLHTPERPYARIASLTPFTILVLDETSPLEFVVSSATKPFRP